MELFVTGLSKLLSIPVYMTLNFGVKMLIWSLKSGLYESIQRHIQHQDFRKMNFLSPLVRWKIKISWALIKDSKVWHFTSQSNSCESGQLQFNFLASHYSGQGRFFIVLRLVYPISLFLIGWIEKNSQRQSLWWCHLLQRWRQTRWWFKSNEPTTNRWTRIGSINSR